MDYSGIWTVMLHFPSALPPPPAHLLLAHLTLSNKPTQLWTVYCRRYIGSSDFVKNMLTHISVDTVIDTPTTTHPHLLTWSAQITKIE